MNTETIPNLNETAANIVENLAYQMAQRYGGAITVNHLAPHLPLSLSLIRSCLDNMVDGHSVIAIEQDGFPIYEFTQTKESNSEPHEVDAQSCLSCTINPRSGEQMLCKKCLDSLEKELTRIAESTGWPAKAVYEHEILYIAAQRSGPQNAADLAGYSRYTLKRMQKKLKAMALEQNLKLDLDSIAATISYKFPKISYPKAAYQRNMEVIRRYPASVAEDIELKIIRIILYLAGMLFAVFVLALLRLPLPILVICFFIIAPIVAFRIWRHRDRPPD
ncbi:MAG: hypothetical protein JRF56_22620 [Deltaproteobacteria bacterium]|jgi:hypothetical protein|nr:hypothetical protein [Deltaproteobacteria bacterium]